MWERTEELRAHILQRLAERAGAAGGKAAEDAGDEVEAGDESASEELALEPESGPGEEVCFHMTPKKGWDRFARGMNASARNVMNWKGYGPVPAPPRPGCWLLPTSDDTAVQMARREEELRQAGWRVLTCDAEVVLNLSDKARLRHYAEKLGLLEFLPVPYAGAEDAEFPCILKSAAGEFGKDCHIVRSGEEMAALVPQGLGERWVLQELIYGSIEYSVTLLASAGELLEVIGTRYEYGSEAYVYPNVRKIGKGPFDVPTDHLKVMKSYLREYSGVCNFNYKVRQDGRICIFEVNTRVGGDLACDVPRPRAQELLRKLRALGGEAPGQRRRAERDQL